MSSGDEQDENNTTVRPGVSGLPSDQANSMASQENTAAQMLERILGKLNEMDTRLSNVERTTAGQPPPIVPSLEPIPTPCTTPPPENFFGNGAMNLPSTASQLTGQLSHVGHKRLLDLPTFAGSTEEWTLFKSAYEMTNQRYGYDDVDNAFRLQKCLTGRAKEAVSNMLSNPTEIPTAMATLELLFGQPIMIVRCAIERARAIPHLNGNNLNEWAPFAAKIRNLAAAVDTPNTQHYNNNPIMLDELVQKLPPNERLQWSDVGEAIHPHATIKDFADWTTKMATRAAHVVTQPLDTSSVSSQRRSHTSDRRPGKSQFLLVSNLKSNPSSISQNCQLCEAPHELADCASFRRMNLEERIQQIRNHRLCFTCFQDNHRSAKCTKRQRCGINGCAGRHHKLLHDEGWRHRQSTHRAASSEANRGGNITTSNGNQQQIAGPSVNQLAVAGPSGVQQQSTIPHGSLMLSRQRDECSDQNLLLRIIPVKLYGKLGIIETFALLDEGAKLTLIEEELADQLEPSDGVTQPLHLSWYGDQTTTEPSRRINLKISGIMEDASVHDIINARTVRGLRLPKQTVRISDLDARYQVIKCLPVDTFTNAVPQILIGLDHPNLGVPEQVVECNERELIAAKTRLGWVVYGREMHSYVGVIQATEEEMGTRKFDEIHEMVQDFHTTENFGVRSTATTLESIYDQRARKLLRETTTRQQDSFETGLLWASDDVHLPASRQMAVNRLTSIESKMRKDLNYRTMYNENIKNYLLKGYARKLAPEEAAIVTPRTWYLPHFGVINPSKPNKLRLVFDAAAMVNGVSLNSKLLTGPDEHNSLPRILFQFRVGTVGVSGDIAEMFHQIAIRPTDQDAQRFLWRFGDPTKPIETFVMRVMTFGARCSPCSAHYVMNLNAEEQTDVDPDAVTAITKNHYVDDFVMSFNSTEAATRITMAVIDIHKRGGFQLRNFRSNSISVLSSLGCPQKNDPVDLRLLDSTEKILGMYWDTTGDMFSFKLNLHRIDPDVRELRRSPTKRQMLSITMSVFDPFGFLCEIILYAKLLVQEVWKIGCDWDDEVPQEVFAKWAQWMNALKGINNLRIPRCYSAHITNATEIQLHVFADASEVAFAACGYWRIKRNDGGYDVLFVTGKTRCAPAKLLSIPRLELQAAVLATRLRSSIESCHELEISRVCFWSDSTTVLSWISSDHRRYKPFVGHRIAEILETTKESDWRYIPTRDNVADDATRAKYPPYFDPESRWLQGPTFLRYDEKEWPQRPDNFARVDDTEEIRVGHLLTIHETTAVFDVTRFSKYNRLRRTAGWVLRFVNNARSKEKKRGELTAEEIQMGERLLLIETQKIGFSTERNALLKGKTIETSSKIHNLLPYLDDQQVMRMYGRADAAEVLPEDTRRPIVLPKDHGLTNLIIDYHHLRMQHQNLDAVICSVRQRFWIPQLRSLAKKRKTLCGLCKRNKMKPVAPIMGQLPSDRVTPYVRPFTFSGLDYFGPISVTIGRRNEKRWVALFTCLTTRAVHLELAADLSSDSCLLCIRNFINIRGVPVRLRSDNGTNFVGADKIIRDLTLNLNSEKVQQELAGKGIEWVFNSASHPEAGGCWERLVRCVKKVLEVTLKETAPKVETLRSVLLEAANIVNSRPLTHLPVDASSEEPLTPNHFLIGCANDTQTPGDINDRELCSRKQFRIAQQLKNRFWKRWVKEYLPDLTRRTKWTKEQPNLKVGDLVIICDDNVNSNRWRRGRVATVYPGPDGRVRNAVVRTSDGELRRPASRLAVLDVHTTA